MIRRDLNCVRILLRRSFSNVSIEDIEYSYIKTEAEGKEVSLISPIKARRNRKVLERVKLFPPNLVQEYDAIELSEKILNNEPLVDSTVVRVKPEDIGMSRQNIPKEPVIVKKVASKGKMDIGFLPLSERKQIGEKEDAAVEVLKPEEESQFISTYLNMTPMAFNMVVAHMERHLNTIVKYIKENEPSGKDDFFYFNKHRRNRKESHPSGTLITRESLEVEARILFARVASNISLQTTDSYNLLLEMWLVLGRMDEFERVLDNMISFTTRIDPVTIKFEEKNANLTVKQLRRIQRDMKQKEKLITLESQRAIKREIYSKFGTEANIKDVHSITHIVKEPKVPLAKILESSPVKPNDYTYHLLLKAYLNDKERFEAIVESLFRRLETDMTLRARTGIGLYNNILRKYLSENALDKFDRVIKRMAAMERNYDEDTILLLVEYYIITKEESKVFQMLDRVINDSKKHIDMTLSTKSKGKKLRKERKALETLKTTLIKETTSIAVKTASPLFIEEPDGNSVKGLLEAPTAKLLAGKAENLPDDVDVFHVKDVLIGNTVLFKIIKTLLKYPDQSYFTRFMVMYQVQITYKQCIEILEDVRSNIESFKVLFNYMMEHVDTLFFDLDMYTVSFRAFENSLEKVGKLLNKAQEEPYFAWTKSVLDTLEAIYTFHNRVDLIQTMTLEAFDTKETSDNDSVMRLVGSVITYYGEHNHGLLKGFLDQLLLRRVVLDDFSYKLLKNMSGTRGDLLKYVEEFEIFYEEKRDGEAALQEHIEEDGEVYEEGKEEECEDYEDIKGEEFEEYESESELHEKSERDYY
jgi:hypothetical protein